MFSDDTILSSCFRACYLSLGDIVDALRSTASAFQMVYLGCIVKRA